MLIFLVFKNHAELQYLRENLFISESFPTVTEQNLFLDPPAPRLPGSGKLNYLQVQWLGITRVIKLKEIFKVTNLSSEHKPTTCPRLMSALENCKCVVILALRKS